MAKMINQLKQLFAFATQSAFPRLSSSLSNFRHLSLGLLLAYNFSLMLSSCGLDIEDPKPPSIPIWVQKSLPEEWPERGIDSHESGGILLEWRQPDNESIDRYEMFRAIDYEETDSLEIYELVAQVDAEIIDTQSYLDQTAELRKRYLYRIKAINNSERESSISEAISYKLLPRITRTKMIPDGVSELLDNDRKLMWWYNFQIEMEDYTLTIISNSNELMYRTRVYPSSYVGDRESLNIPSSVQLSIGQIYKWRIDLGADYLLNVETTGSESEWAYFIYMG
jgi:hypothetical protein